MTKKQLIEQVSRKAHLTKRGATEAVETFLGEIQRALTKGDRVIISGFGTFFVDQLKKKKMFLRGKEEEIPSHRAPKFHAGKTLKRVVRR
ncbi:DNA-binding protein HU [Candidatus Woesebacteria bacterium]|nr:DNA-binding protein HU [Candidatus Woesebacteria bacterium]|tara:strand:- start:1108 stop:1377 length:270 start_codon:yes stop_codon:yes gene_type:complete